MLFPPSITIRCANEWQPLEGIEIQWNSLERERIQDGFSHFAMECTRDASVCPDSPAYSSDDVSDEEDAA